MRLISILLCFLFIAFTPLSSSAINPNLAHHHSVNFKRDVDRLMVLQDKFNTATDPVEKFKYSAAISAYLKTMVIKADEIATVYYIPAILIMTNELPGIKFPPAQPKVKERK